MGGGVFTQAPHWIDASTLPRKAHVFFATDLHALCITAISCAIVWNSMMFIWAMKAEKRFLHHISRILKSNHNWQGPPCREWVKHLVAQEGNLRRWLEAFSGGTQNSANSCKLCLLSRSSRRFFDLNPQYLNLVWFISIWKECLDWLWHFSCLYLFYVLLPLFIPMFVVFVWSVVLWRSKPNLQISPEAEHEVVAAHEELMASRGLKLWNRLRVTAAIMKPLRWIWEIKTFVWLSVWKPELCKTLVIPACLLLDRSLVNVYWHLQYKCYIGWESFNLRIPFVECMIRR